MPLPCAGYQPREAERGVLYRVVDAHLDAFLDAAAHHAEGARLPMFVEQEFRDFLTCGVLAHGFARLRCGECAFERLVPFSCKGRGFCPSCGGRRMTESAARLVDHVLPHVPVRQWVLSLPYRLRYLLAWNHDLCRAVLGIYARALLAFQRRRAHRCRGRGGQSGCVTVIQRFGGRLNLNVHFHTLVLDGVFTEGPGEMLRFQPTPPPTDDEVGLVLATIATRVRRLLRRRGLDAEADVAPPDLLAEESAEQHGVPESLISAVIRVESGFNPQAVSRKGARGLMQLMPGTASMLGVRNSFDPRQNIEGGVRHLRGLIDRFGSDLKLALAAYNAGEQAVLNHRGIPPSLGVAGFSLGWLASENGERPLCRFYEAAGRVKSARCPPRGLRVVFPE